MYRHRRTYAHCIDKEFEIHRTDLFAYHGVYDKLYVNAYMYSVVAIMSRCFNLRSVTSCIQISERITIPRRSVRVPLPWHAYPPGAEPEHTPPQPERHPAEPGGAVRPRC